MPAARLSGGRPLVLLAMIASSAISVSSCAYSACFSGRRSGIASISSVDSARSLRLVVPAKRARTACWWAASNCPLSCSSCKIAAATAGTSARRDGSVSYSRTRWPWRAKWQAIPIPISPAPSTASVGLYIVTPVNVRWSWRYPVRRRRREWQALYWRSGAAFHAAG